MDGSNILFLFYFLISASQRRPAREFQERSALYTEIRKLSGNEYRDVYNLPISSNSSLTFQRRKTLFKWDIGNNTIGQSKALSFSNRTKSKNQKRKLKKGDVRWQTILGNESNGTDHGRINLLSHKNDKKNRLKRKRDSKKIKRKKKQKTKREKRFRNKNEITENNLSKSKANKTFEITPRSTTNNMTDHTHEKQISSEHHGTLAEEPKKLVLLANKYEPQKSLESLHNSFENNNTLKKDYEPHFAKSMKHAKQYNEIIDKYDTHIPSFRSKWKEYAQRNFTSDNNECLINNGGCEGLCINTPGSYRCHCPQGFRLDLTRKLCLDVNECTARNGHGPCQGECTNTWGSFRCGCQTVKGTHLADDKKSCTVIDACSTHNCSHVCINTRLGAFCSCPLGFVLGNDWITCEDIDECQHNDLQQVKCDKNKCENTIGSYKCT